MARRGDGANRPRLRSIRNENAVREARFQSMKPGPLRARARRYQWPTLCVPPSSRRQWTGDKESMIERNVAVRVRQAAEQGAQVMCFQELFYGPYFCQVQDRRATSTTPEAHP